jgi:hypothetical protein
VQCIGLTSFLTSARLLQLLLTPRRLCCRARRVMEYTFDMQLAGNRSRNPSPSARKRKQSSAPSSQFPSYRHTSHELIAAPCVFVHRAQVLQSRRSQCSKLQAAGRSSRPSGSVSVPIILCHGRLQAVAHLPLDQSSD